MIVTDPSVLVPDAPAIDVTEARWALEYLSLLIGRLDADSPIRMVLQQTRRELASLTQGSVVVGPLRIAA